MSVLLEGADTVPEALARRLVADADTALTHLGVAHLELSLTLTTDAGIQPINAQWRGQDRPTDVLSFPQWEGDWPAPPAAGSEPTDGPVLPLGDVVVSVETAARQAAERGHDLATELRILVVHGLAHLVGHDHHHAADAERMAEVEQACLAALGESAAGLVAAAAHAAHAADEAAE